MKWLKRLWYRIKNKFYEPPVTPTVQPDEDLMKPVPIPREGVDFPNLLTNKEGLMLCAESEGVHKKLGNGLIGPYKCPANVWTIGRGTIQYPEGTPVKGTDMPITLGYADYLFKYEMDEKENKLDEHLKKHGIELNSNEFSALVSFMYNLGEDVVLTKNYSMGRAILSGDRQRIADAFMLYTKAKNRWGIKRTLRGLVIRRKKEQTLFLKPME